MSSLKPVAVLGFIVAVAILCSFVFRDAGEKAPYSEHSSTFFHGKRTTHIETPPSVIHVLHDDEERFIRSVGLFHARSSEFIGKGNRSYCALGWKYSYDMRVDRTLDDHSELQFILDHLRCMKPLVLLRFGDGEWAIMNGRSLKAQDKWTFRGSHASPLSTQLWESLHSTQRAVTPTVGLPFARGKKLEASRRIWSFMNRTDLYHVTCAFIFVNKNYEGFKRFVLNELSDTKTSGTCVIGLLNELVREKPSWMTAMYLFPSNSVQHFENATYRSRMLTRSEKVAQSVSGRCVVLVSVGPVSEVLIDRMSRVNALLTYVDVGSAIHEFVDSGERLHKRAYIKNGTNLRACGIISKVGLEKRRRKRSRKKQG